jgi:F0F1-type ATP synthase assembly protein I
LTDPDIPIDRQETGTDVTARSKLVPPRDLITGGFSKKADLLSYFVAGLLIGLFLDQILWTSPLMTVVWTLLGLGVGAYRLWMASADLEEEGKRRGHGV